MKSSKCCAGTALLRTAKGVSREPVDSLKTAHPAKDVWCSHSNPGWWVVTARKARIVVANAEVAFVYCPFELKEIVKAFPSRRWDRYRKAWAVYVAHVDHVADALRAGGCTVHLTTLDGQPWTSGSEAHGHRETPSADWVAHLLAAVGPDRHKVVCDALATTLEPLNGTGNVGRGKLRSHRADQPPPRPLPPPRGRS
jgi:hypothetical protein